MVTVSRTMSTSDPLLEISSTTFFTYETELTTIDYATIDYEGVDGTTWELPGTTLPTLDWTTFKTVFSTTSTPIVTDYQNVAFDTNEGSHLSTSLSDVLSIATAVFLVSIIIIKVTTLMLHIFNKEKGYKKPENPFHQRYLSIQLEAVEHTEQPSDLGSQTIPHDPAVLPGKEKGASNLLSFGTKHGTSELTTGIASFRSQEKLNEISVQMHSSTGSRSQHVGSPPRISLPELPGTDKEETKDTNDIQEDEYCVLRMEWQNSKVIERKDIRFNKQVFLGGVICDLWKARLGSEQKKKRIFITTPKDTICSFVSWETLVQKYLSLSKNPQILQVEGFCMEPGKILLVHEYFNVKVLREVLSTEEVNNQSERLVDQFMNYSEQVASGMEFAFSHGLSHPTLNTSKVCVTRRNQCKLYDFCLIEDAPKVMELVKSKDTFDSEKYPPEFIAKNEYSFVSDVWYTALTIMEIFYQGAIQTTSTEDDTYGIAEEEVITKPTLCPDPVYEIINKCLHSEPSLRPNISKLRSDLQQEMSLYLEQSACSTMADQDVYSTIEEQYMIMKGKVH